MRIRRSPLAPLVLSFALLAPAAHAQKKPAAPKDPPKLAAEKREAVARVDSMAKLTQEMVDMLFSFGELGFQERRYR